jgi:uncharacterized membrane protein YvlD (DUF360 family)
MAVDFGVHIDCAAPSFDKPIIESLMIPLEVIVLGVFLHSVAEMLLSQWDNLGQTLRLDGANESLGVGVQIWTSHGKLHGFDAGGF